MFEKSTIRGSRGFFLGVEDEGEIKFVYVRNLPTTLSFFETANEFKNLVDSRLVVW